MLADRAARKAVDFFDPQMEAGNFFVMEDGVVADLPGAQYGRFDDRPNRAVETFLDATGDAHQIDTGLCDFYGHNITYAPNAWLRRR
ncbi:CmcI family methyltransferase [Marinicauda salina]|nr:CmcI family methyltransferase [Marinicauda salina]